MLNIHDVCKKYFVWNPATCTCKNDKYLASIIDNSVLTCEEMKESKETKTILKNISKTKNFYILLFF